MTLNLPANVRQGAWMITPEWHAQNSARLAELRAPRQGSLPLDGTLWLDGCGPECERCDGTGELDCTCDGDGCERCDGLGWIECRCSGGEG